jgi:guanyl-specific ribonuclease Sa
MNKTQSDTQRQRQRHSHWLVGVLAAVVLIGLVLATLRAQPATPLVPPAPQAQNTAPVANIADAAKATTTQKPKATRTPNANGKPIVDGFIVRNVKVINFGRVFFTGDIDLKPTLDRIAKGIRDAHPNDGSVFGNFERKLPSRPRGYYKEYVHRTRGINGPGPQRVILGRNGEIFYTPDHYESFIKVK